jgi:hypothetical protein
MRLKYVCRAARVLTLVLSPLATAPAAAELPARASLVRVPVGIGRPDGIDASAALADGGVNRIRQGREAAATAAHDLGEREAHRV